MQEEIEEKTNEVIEDQTNDVIEERTNEVIGGQETPSQNDSQVDTFISLEFKNINKDFYQKVIDFVNSRFVTSEDNSADELVSTTVKLYPNFYYGTDAPSDPQELSYSLDVTDVIGSKKKNPGTCFNCGKKGHMVANCPDPYDAERIKLNRIEMRSITNNVRYYQQKTCTRTYQPCILSKELLKALNVKENELPSFIYKMNYIGFPSAYLPHQKSKSLSIIGESSEGNNNTNSPDETQELINDDNNNNVNNDNNSNSGKVNNENLISSDTQCTCDIDFQTIYKELPKCIKHCSIEKYKYNLPNETRSQSTKYSSTHSYTASDKYSYSNPSNYDKYSTNTSTNYSYGDRYVAPTPIDKFTPSHADRYVESKHIMIDKYSDKYTDKYTDKYSDKYGEKYSDKFADRYSDKYSDKYTDKYTDKYADKYSDKYADRYADNEKYSEKYSDKYSEKYADKYSEKYTDKYSDYKSRNMSDQYDKSGRSFSTNDNVKYQYPSDTRYRSSNLYTSSNIVSDDKDKYSRSYDYYNTDRTASNNIRLDQYNYDRDSYDKNTTYSYEKPTYDSYEKNTYNYDKNDAYQSYSAKNPITSHNIAPPLNSYDNYTSYSTYKSPSDSYLPAKKIGRVKSRSNSRSRNRSKSRSRSRSRSNNRSYYYRKDYTYPPGYR